MKKAIYPTFCLLAITLVIAISGCGKKEKTQVQFEDLNFLGAAGLTTVSHSGIVVMGRSETLGESFYLPVSPTDSEASVKITSGTWSFTAYQWPDGSGPLGGVPSCSSVKDIDLQGDSQTISFPLSVDHCKLSDLSSSKFLDASGDLFPLTLTSCSKSVSNMSSGDIFCDGSNAPQGNMQSFRPAVLGVDQPLSTTSLESWDGKTNPFGAPKLFGNCHVLDTPTAKVDTGLYFPLGGSMGSPLLIEAYPTTDCSGTASQLFALKESSPYVSLEKGTGRVTAYLSDENDQVDLSKWCHSGGVRYDSRCWYLSASGDSCANMCSSIGEPFNVATIYLAGGHYTVGSNDAYCQNVLNNLGYQNASVSSSYYGNSIGCAIDTTTSAAILDSSDTTSTATLLDHARACACGDDPPGVWPLDLQVKIINPPAGLDVDTCSPAFQLELYESDGITPYAALEDISVPLSPGANATIYGDPSCTSPVSSATIAQGQSLSSDLYFKGTSVNSSISTNNVADHSTWGTTYQSFTLNPGPPAEVKLTGSKTIRHSYCGGFFVKSFDQFGNPSPVGADVTITAQITNTVSSSGLVGTITNDNTCGDGATSGSLTLAAGTDSVSYIYGAFSGGTECDYIEVTVSAPGFPNQIRYVQLDNSPYGECTPPP